MHHWHETEDEFVFVISGEATLIDGNGEQEMNSGDYATFKAEENNALAIINKSNDDVVLLKIGSRAEKDIVRYEGKDLINFVNKSQIDQNIFKDSSGKIIYLR